MTSFFGLESEMVFNIRISYSLSIIASEKRYYFWSIGIGETFKGNYRYRRCFFKRYRYRLSAIFQPSIVNIMDCEKQFPENGHSCVLYSAIEWPCPPHFQFGPVPT